MLVGIYYRALRVNFALTNHARGKGKVKWF